MYQPLHILSKALTVAIERDASIPEYDKVQIVVVIYPKDRHM
jgi:hypothetical protein